MPKRLIDDPTHLRLRAAEMRDFALEAQNAKLRAIMLEIALGYYLLAQLVEERFRRGEVGTS